MPLDENPLPAPVIPVPGDEWDGPWGSISPVPHSLATLCIQIENERYQLQVFYFSYGIINKWNWKMDSPEDLEIQAGSDLIKIKGTGLRRLSEAINLRQLRLINGGLRPISTGEICILSIEF